MDDALEIMNELGKTLPRFPDGRIDYTHAKSAPVVVSFVRHKGKILLIKRSDKVAFYKRMWNSVSGYLDDMKPVKEKALEELEEELGIVKKDISSMKEGKTFRVVDKKINREWIIFTVLVELETIPEIRLEQENTRYIWIRPEELQAFDTVPGLEEELKAALS